MIGLHLVRPLEDPWQGVLDAVLASQRAAPLRDVARLAPQLAALSRAYNTGAVGEPNQPRAPLAARIAFSFARDVPKGAGAVRELVGVGALRIPKDRPLRVLDLGAGLGAMSWGVARALERAGERGALEVLFVDDDANALAVASAIAREASMRGAAPANVSLHVETRAERLRLGMKLPAADLVIAGQVLSELDRDAPSEARVAAHAALVADWLSTLVLPGGALVVVEPALADRTRHLHAVRDRLLGSTEATLFAPCLHAAPCPALAEDGQWCHEDLPVDLPTWLVPLARAAGLRFQGLTFSYVVLRRDELSLARLSTSSPGRHLRVVSDRFVTKGKVELFGCTSEGARVRLRRLDRDRAPSNAAWDELGRGAVVTVRSPDPAHPPIDERGRVAREAHVCVGGERALGV